MLYDLSKQSDLRRWLIRTLEPICDADPQILADYVIALLNHESPESVLRPMFVKQLDEFLEQNTVMFVDSLFSALRSKAYIPYSSLDSRSSKNRNQASSDGGIPIPLDAVMSPVSPTQERSRKRTFDDRESVEHPQDSRQPPRGPRRNVQIPPQRHPPTRPRADAPTNWSRGASHAAPRNNNRASHSEVTSENGISLPTNGVIHNLDSNLPPPQHERPICRDYHQKGYCARGAACKYSHGDDALIPPGSMWTPPGFNPMMGNVPFLPMMMPFAMQNGNGILPGGAYDPNESRMDISSMASPQLSLGGPTLPLIETHDMMVDAGMEQHPSSFPLATFGNMFPSMPTIASSNGSMGSAPTIGNRNTQPGNRGAAKGDKTLVIEKIPTDQLRLEAINDWFKKFGTVTNVAVDAKGAKALVSFSNHDDAIRAWKSQDAVFGNRFVKVYWHRPMEGQGGAGKRALEASASAIQAHELNALVKIEEPSNPTNLLTIAKTEAATVVKPKSNPAVDAVSKAEALEKNIAEQKALFARLKTASGDEKKDILAQIRILSDNMPQLPTTGSVSASAQATTSGEQSSKLRRLDKELDLQQAVQELTRRAQDPDEDHEAVRAELTILMEKAASEGIAMNETSEPAPSNQYYPSQASRRPFRSRGRGRGFYRSAVPYARGHPRNLKLDNRPKKLVVRGVPPENDQLLDHVREWHQATGQADTLTVGDDGEVTAQFKTRAAAELALASSPQLASHIEGVKVAWPAISTVLQPGVSSDVSVKPSLDDSTDATMIGAVDEETGWGNE